MIEYDQNDHERDASNDRSVNQRLYDSEIFVMSNTTFDDDMITNSRRASEGR